jgi:hypothetical protein
MLPRPSAARFGNAKSAETRDVAQGVGVRRVSKRRGVGHGADTNTIEDDPDGATEH